MANNDAITRHSKAHTPTIETDAQKRAELESLNALRQFDYAMHLIDEGLERGFKLRPSIICSLHREALQDLSINAGRYRPSRVEIGGSKHEPVGAHLVSEEVEKLCDYVNENWDTLTAIHLSAYVMWRLNWIHPFDDGNGRTSRIVSYLILCLKTGMKLPGSNTIPEQIAENKTPYYNALEEADRRWNNGALDLTDMENLIDSMLAAQICSIHSIARDGHNRTDEIKKLH